MKTNLPTLRRGNPCGCPPRALSQIAPPARRGNPCGCPRRALSQIAPPARRGNPCGCPPRALTILAALILTLIAACAPQPVEPPDAHTIEIELIRGPVSEDGVQAIFATPDLGVGQNRVAFAIQSPDGLIDAPSAAVQSFYEPDPDALGEPAQTAFALFRPFPLVQRGLYATQLTFDKPGVWGIRATTIGEDGAPIRARLFFDVSERPSAPAVGDAAPRSQSRTLQDAESIAQLTTGTLQDADLYGVTIADAVQTGKPTVVVMASPAFCVNAVCGPQVEVLSELKGEFAGRANFIHIDLYDNPHEIQGDLDRAIISPTVREWNLPSGEWTFVIDRDGAIAARFEGFATLDELRDALEDAL